MRCIHAFVVRKVAPLAIGTDMSKSEPGNLCHEDKATIVGFALHRQSQTASTKLAFAGNLCRIQYMMGHQDAGNVNENQEMSKCAAARHT